MNKASERQARYDAKATTRVALKLNNNTDADIIKWLEKQPSKQGAIKQLIRKAIKEEPKPKKLWIVDTAFTGGIIHSHSFETEEEARAFYDEMDGMAYRKIYKTIDKRAK